MRKKKTVYWTPRKAFFFLILGALFAFLAWQWRSIASFARNVALVRSAPDALTALRSFQHTTFGVICTESADAAEDCFVFSEEGVIFNGARTVVGDMIIRVSDRSGDKPQIGAFVVDPDSWENIVPIMRFVRGESLDIADFILKRTEREIDIILAGGTVLRFSYEFDPASHLRALVVLREKVPFESLEYLDMRVEGKIFYK